MKEINGQPDGRGAHVAVVVARFNNFITESLKAGAIRALVENGVIESDIDILYCPGALELPAVARICVQQDKFQAVIALGAVIRGETDHYDYVCRGVTDGLVRLNLKSPIPIIFGVLTCQNIELARARADIGRTNKGYESALAALEMIDLYRQIRP